MRLRYVVIRTNSNVVFLLSKWFSFDDNISFFIEEGWNIQKEDYEKVINQLKSGVDGKRLLSPVVMPTTSIFLLNVNMYY